MIINYEKTTSYVLAEYLASEFVFVLSEHWLFYFSFIFFLFKVYFDYTMH